MIVSEHLLMTPWMVVKSLFLLMCR